MPDPLWKKKRLKLSRAEYDKQREQIFEHQDYLCASCGRRRPLTLDHKIKRSQLGGDERTNLSALCVDCHRNKDEYKDRKNLPGARSNGIRKAFTVEGDQGD